MLPSEVSTPVVMLRENSETVPSRKLVEYAKLPVPGIGVGVVVAEPPPPLSSGENALLGWHAAASRVSAIRSAGRTLIALNQSDRFATLHLLFPRALPVD